MTHSSVFSTFNILFQCVLNKKGKKRGEAFFAIQFAELKAKKVLVLSECFY